MRRAAGLLAAVACAGVCLGAQTPAPAMDAADLQRVRAMLRDARDVVKSLYYDKKFHGVDIDASYKEFNEELKTATSLNVGMTKVAAFLERLHDSHVFLYPPPRPFRIDYGYRLNAIGDGIFVTHVRPGSDAEGKLEPGDQVLLMNNGRTSRSSFQTMQYLFGVLQPQRATQLKVRAPDGSERTVLVNADITDLPRRGAAAGSAVSVDLEDVLRQTRDQELTTNRRVELGDVMIWKMPSFFGTPSDVDDVFDKVKGHGALVIDVRGNPGGSIMTLNRVISHLFTKSVKIGQRIERDGTFDMKADGRRDAFAGRVIILTDAGSGSAAELLARVVQLEHRGDVIGDRSSGAVMEARIITASQGGTLKMIYAFSVTVANIVMTDGVSLEGVGVTPDELLLPSARDLASARDPVLARAAKLAGLDLDPVAAGKLFPFEWK